MSKKIKIDPAEVCRYCVVYASKTGFTQKYAAYIAERLGCRAYAAGEVLPSADLYIAGGGIYQGNALSKSVVEGLNQGGRRVVAFAVGLMRPQEGKGERVAAKNFPQTKCFYFRGGYAPEELSVVQRLGMKLMYRIYKRRESPDYRDTAAAIAAGGADFTQLSAADELIDYVKTYLESQREVSSK